MEKVLVTGGTGFTGLHLVRSLVADGYDVRVLARSAERARKVLPPEVDVVVGDVADAAAVGRAIKGREVVYQLAAAFREAGIPDSRYREIHVDATRLLLEAAKAEGVRRVVHCSTCGVHGHVERPPADETAPYSPGDIYQETKLEGEQLALKLHREQGVPVTVGRPGAIYGPGDMRLLKMFRMIAKGRFVILGPGTVTFHMVYVDDLVRGFRLLADRPEAVGEVYILAGEEYRSLNELTAMIADAVGGSPPRVHLPVWPFYMAGAVMEKVCIPFGIEPPIYRRRVAFFTKSRAFSIEKARRVLGYQPRMDLRTGIATTARWYRDHGYLGRG